MSGRRSLATSDWVAGVRPALERPECTRPWWRSSRLSLAGRCIAVAALALLGTSVRADCGGVHPYGACTQVNVTLLYIDANADAWLTVSGNMSALPCTLNGDLIRLPTSSANFKAVYATLLAAHMAGRAVNVRVDPGVQACTVAYVTVP